MCGRYYVKDDLESEIRRVLKQSGGDCDLPMPGMQSRDVHPSEAAAVIASRTDKQLTCEEMTWGFPNPKNTGLLINARSETVFDKPMFSDGILHRRCVIPASGFYEWDHAKNKVTFTREDSTPVWLGGLFSSFGDTCRFVILTTGANASMLPVHDRMPVILDEGQINEWINDGSRTRELLAAPMPLLGRSQEYEQLSLF